MLKAGAESSDFPMPYRLYFILLLTVTSTCLARENEGVPVDTVTAGRANNLHEEVTSALSGLIAQEGRDEARAQVLDTISGGWHTVASVPFEVVPGDTTVAGRWSSITGTSFLDAGEWPYIDREGNLWWARQQEVFVLKQNQLSQMTFDHQVRVIVRDAAGAMWFFGHARDSLIASRYDGATWETTKTKMKWDLIVRPPGVVDGKGRFWMRAEPLFQRSHYSGYGIFEYADRRWYHHTTKAGLMHDRIYDLAVDREGHVWAATLKSASRYRGNRWHNYNRTDGLSSERVYRIAVGKNGDVWCTHGNRHNISVFDGGKWRVIDNRAGMPVNAVRAALGARDGAFWFGTHHRDIADPDQCGLIRFDGQAWIALTKSDGLPGSWVWKIAELPNDKLLLQIPDRALTVFEPDATQWARISGHVENRAGKAMPSIAVSATTPDSHVKASAATDARGFYELKVSPGDYRIQVPDAWGGGRDLVVRPGEVVKGVDIRPMWFVDAVMQKLIFAMLASFLIIAVLVGAFHLIIQAVASQSPNALAREDFPNALRLRFHGKGRSLFGVFVVNTLLTLLTFGVYYFWGRAKIRRYMHSQTALHDSRFSNTTTGGELCVGWIKAVLLIVTITVLSEVPSFFWENTTHEWITLIAFYGLLLFLFLPMALVGSWRFRLSRTSWRGIRLSFRGDVKKFFKIYYVGLLKTLFTLGFYYPYFETKMRRFMTQDTRFGTGRFDFSGRGRDLFGPFAMCMLLSPFTLFLCWVWYSARKTRYYWAHTTLEGIPFLSTVGASRLLSLKVGNFILLVLSLGLAWPWVAVRNSRFWCAHLALAWQPDFSRVAQDFSDAGATGEGMSDYLNFEFEF